MISEQTITDAFSAHGLKVSSRSSDNSLETGAGLYRRHWTWDSQNERWTDQHGSEVYAADGYENFIARQSC